jgi:hypothetical protein
MYLYSRAIQDHHFQNTNASWKRFWYT